MYWIQWHTLVCSLDDRAKATRIHLLLNSLKRLSKEINAKKKLINKLNNKSCRNSAHPVAIAPKIIRKRMKLLIKRSQRQLYPKVVYNKIKKKKKI